MSSGEYDELIIFLFCKKYVYMNKTIYIMT